MGVDTRVFLPAHVRARDVAEVMGCLAGLPAKREPQERGHIYCYVDGVEVKPTGVAGLSDINLKAPKGQTFVDGETTHFAYYHYEIHRPAYDGDKVKGDFRQVAQRATAFWIAIFKGLVNHFGGFLDYQDCDDSEVDYKKPVRNKVIFTAYDGKPWDDLQNYIENVKPLTTEDYAEADKLAAYHLDGSRG